MDRNEVVAKTIEICKDVFDDETIVLNEESCAANVKEWDSLAHLSIISDLESEFKIKFTFAEITNAKNVGELVDAIMAK